VTNPKKNPDLKSSLYWNNFTFIYITGTNWSTAVGQGWCSGSGNWSDPYTIENMMIDASSSPTGSGILIENSKNSFFVIKNVTVFNTPSGTSNAGIKLISSNNGTLININASNNNGQSRGILLDSNSDNNTLIENTANNNYMGIVLNIGCDDNNIINNTANSNTYAGIELYNNNQNNIIFNNTVNNNGGVNWYGIYLYNSDWNKIGNNTVNNNGDGIRLYNSDNCVIANNSISGNVENGIEFNFPDNTISANTMINNGLYILSTIADMRTTIIHANNTVNGRQIYFYLDRNGLNSNNFINAGQIILLNCTNSVISNLNLSYSSLGLELINSNNNTIRNITSNNNRWSFYLTDSSSNNSIYNNTAKNSDIGIRLNVNSENNTLTNNTFTSNTFAGIHLSEDCNYNTIQDNIANNNERGIYILRSNYNQILNNTVNANNQDGIWVYESENSIIKNNSVSNNNINVGDFGGIHLEYGSNFTTIKGNMIRNSGGTFDQDNGVLLENDCNNNSILNNEFVNLMRGIYLWIKCNNNTISGNNLYEDDGGVVFLYGIQLNDNNERNKIINNTIRNHAFLGFFLHVSSDHNFISGNKIWHNDGLVKGNIGITMNNAGNNTVLGNTFTNHSNYGILIQNNCDDNNFTENLIANNTYRGAEIDDITCIDNKFWLNEFINNGLHAKDDSNPGFNQWDNGIIGNYWDNYTGVDANDDGIGDSYYNVEGIAQANDTKPIWNDGDDIAPILSVLAPIPNQIFGNTAPDFNILITDINLNSTWYSLWNGSVLTSNRTFSYGFDVTIDQAIWDQVGNGTVLISFFANDSFGNWNYIDIMIRKDVITPILIILNPVDNEIRVITERDFTFNIIEDNLDTMWYSIIGGQNHPFTLNGTFNQADWETAWDSTSIGGTFSISFFANDTAGNIVQVDILIRPDKSEGGGISFGLFFLAFSLISLISLVGILKKKVIQK